MTKIAIITGANGGMGKVLTENIAKAGFLTIMACHNEQNARPVFETLSRKYPHRIIMEVLNLSSFHSIYAFVEKIKTRYDKVDLLLNNAGTLQHTAQTTEDGFDMTAGVNYLGHYFLTTQLFPLFVPGTRVVNMASLSWKWFPLQPDFLQPVRDRKFNRFVTYSNSKRALVYFMLDKATEWGKKGITFNCADPGIVNTGIVKQGNKTIDTLCDIFFRPLIKSPEKGAISMLHLALSPEMEGITGKYFTSKKEKIIKRNRKVSREMSWLRDRTSRIFPDFVNATPPRI